MGVDEGVQHRIDPRLIAATAALEEIQHTAVDAHVQHRLRLRHFRRRLGPIDDHASLVGIVGDCALQFLFGHRRPRAQSV
ncbi:MAG TPA: hypothetical protein VIJ42_08315 [Stellaceae bacterium]